MTPLLRKYSACANSGYIPDSFSLLESENEDCLSCNKQYVIIGLQGPLWLSKVILHIAPLNCKQSHAAGFLMEDILAISDAIVPGIMPVCGRQPMWLMWLTTLYRSSEAHFIINQLYKNKHICRYLFTVNSSSLKRL